MIFSPQIEEIYQTVTALERTGSSPFLPVIETIESSSARLKNGSRGVMFASCDYLGMSRDNDVKRAAISAIERFGTNTFGAQILSGYTVIHEDLERRLAQTLEQERALLFPSGLHANVGVISTLTGPEDIVLNDRLNHVSILLGTKLGGAKTRSFPHKDYDRLEALLKEAGSFRNRLIVTDGLFSADGDMADLARICDLAQRFDATVMVDEAHSFGIMGATGRGAVEACDVLQRVDLIMGTMSKAVGSTGGFLAGRAAFIDRLRWTASSYTSSRGLAPAVAAAALASIGKICKADFQPRATVMANVERMTKALNGAGLNTLDTISPIVPVVVGDSERTIAVVQSLASNGLFVSAMVAPAVPPGLGRLRLGVTAWHSTDDCDLAVELIARAKREFSF